MRHGSATSVSTLLYISDGACHMLFQVGSTSSHDLNHWFKLLVCWHSILIASDSMWAVMWQHLKAHVHHRFILCGNRRALWFQPQLKGC